VAIARAVINRPKILIADEPTGNVDLEIGVRIMHLFEELNRHGTTIVIATHDNEIVSRFPHPQIRLENGTIADSTRKTARGREKAA
jgi:cell division transport system ATP-binding protein